MPSGYWCSQKNLNSQHLPPQGSASTNWAMTAKWCPRSESNRQHAGFESASSANWDTGAKLVLVVLLRWYNQENLDRPIAARRRLKTLGYNHPNSNTYGVTHWFSGR